MIANELKVLDPAVLPCHPTHSHAALAPLSLLAGRLIMKLWVYAKKQLNFIFNHQHLYWHNLQ